MYKKRLFDRVAKNFSGKGLRAELLRGGVGSLLLKASNALLAFAVAVILARTLGLEGYGTYSFALAVLMLAAIPAQVGVPQLIIRETAKAQATEKFGLMRGLWRWGNVAVAMFSSLALLVVGGIVLLTDIADSARITTLTVGLALIPLIALANVRGACLRGLRKVIQGQLPESIIRPILLLLMVLVWGNMTATEPLTPQYAMGLYVIAAVVAFLFGVWLLKRVCPKELSSNPTPEYLSTEWRKSVGPLAFITSLQLVNNYADLIIIGYFRTDEEVGIYRAATQVGFLVLFGLQAINQILQPYIASYYYAGKIDKLKKIVQKAVLFNFIAASSVLFILVLFGEYALGFIFGRDFESGYIPLMILSMGFWLKSLSGPAAQLLKMTGHESMALKVLFISISINIILNLILVPYFGMEGAAFSTAVSLAVWHFLLKMLCSKYLGIDPSIISVFIKNE